MSEVDVASIDRAYRRKQSRLNYLYIQQGLSRFTRGKSPYDSLITQLERELYDMRQVFPFLTQEPQREGGGSGLFILAVGVWLVILGMPLLGLPVIGWGLWRLTR